MNRVGRSARIGLGVVIAVYAAANGLLFLPNVTLVRLGVPPLFFPEKPSPFLTVLVEIPWWQFVIWPVAIGFLSWAAVRLLAGRAAVKIYAAAVAIDLAFLSLLKIAGARSGRSGAIDPDYIVAAVLLLILVAVWATEHRQKSIRGDADNPD